MGILPDSPPGGTSVGPDFSPRQHPHYRTRICTVCEGSRFVCGACLDPWRLCQGGCGTVFSTEQRCDTCKGTGREPIATAEGRA